MKKLITALLIIAQLLCIVIPVGAVSAPEADGFVSKSGESSLLGNDISFFVPDASDNIITQSTKVENQTYTTVSGSNIPVSLTKNGVEQSIENVAYVAYKIKNNSSQVINIGTRLNIFSSVTRQAGATAPLCFDAQTGAQLSLTDSWSYSSNKLISDQSAATVEIPAGAEIYMVLPITSVNDSSRYVPAIEKSAAAFDGSAKTNGNLRAKNSSATSDMTTKYESNGYLYLRSLDVYYSGSGASRDYSNPVSYEVSGVYFMTREDYTLKTAETNVSLLKSPLRFFMPDQSKNLVSASTTVNNATYTANTASSIDLSIKENGAEVKLEDLAYITYKFTNNGESVINIGTRLNLYSSNTKRAGATLVYVYDATTGERLDYTESWSYSSTPLISDGTVATVEIPAGATVYIVVPMTTVNESDRYVPALEKAETVFNTGKPAKTEGNLRARNADEAAEMHKRYEQNGYQYLRKIEVFCGGSGATRSFASTFSYEVSGVWAMTRQEYTERYTEMNFAMDSGASVYMNQKAGIRFTSSVNSADYYYLVDRYGKDNVSFGTIITPAAYVQAAGALTFEALNALDTQVYGDVKYLDVQATEFFSEDGASFKIAGSIVDIKTANYNLAFSSVSYIKIVDGEEVIYIYADSVQTRSIAQVAQLAVDDRSAAQTEAYANYIGDGNAKGAYSPYTPEQINVLKGFYS